MGEPIKPLGAPKRDLLLAVYELGSSKVVLTQLAKRLKKANSTVHQHLRELAEGKPALVKQHPLHGWWDLTEGGHGAVQALLSVEQPEVEQRGLQCWGHIAAGPAILLNEEREDDTPIIDLDPDQHFTLRVAGNSMVDYGIHDGDLIVLKRVDSWLSVRPSDIVALRVPEGTTVVSEETLNQVMTAAEEASEPILDHGTLKKLTGDNLLSLCQSIEQGRIRLSVTGSRSRVVRALAFQIIGVLVRIQRDYR